MKEVKMSCTTCPNSCEMIAVIEDNKVVSVKGNKCKRGIDFAEKEWIAPERMLTSTMIMETADGEISVPVKSEKPMLRSKMMEAMEAIRTTRIDHPVKMGDVLIPNVAGCGVDIVASKTVN